MPKGVGGAEVGASCGGARLCATEGESKGAWKRMTKRVRVRGVEVGASCGGTHLYAEQAPCDEGGDGDDAEAHGADEGEGQREAPEREEA
eukprot:7083578-Prymnesium_polylepis.1